ncbi:MAG: asparaginase [Anaerolineae bacterium]|nr:asparaginase [Gemmatimonadaceae bacterium]
MKTVDLDVIAVRGDTVESRHRVHAAVVDHSATMRASAGDPNIVTFWRSCAKPFQLMPWIASGGSDALGWSHDELALACASHGGEPEHIAIARKMLADADLDEGDLACGVHEPLSRRGVRMAEKSGAALSRLHNNCSGKHAAMLAFARHSKWSLLGYEKRGHPVQRAALESVAEWTGVDPERIPQGVDGCAVVTFALPLDAMALAFARLGHSSRNGDEIPTRIVAAMQARPFLVGGTDRFDSVLMEESRGSIIAKVGAEGVHCVSIPDESIGLAVKAEDGATRAQHAAVLRLLQHLGHLPNELGSKLAAFLRAPVLNTRGEEVGTVAPAK